MFVGVLVSYIGIVEFQKRGLQATISQQLVDINTLKTEYASEQGRSTLYKNQITDVNKKLQSVTLLLDETRGIIINLESERNKLNEDLKRYEFELVSMKQATEHINNAFQRSISCLEASTGKDDTLCTE